MLCPLCLPNIAFVIAFLVNWMDCPLGVANSQVPLEGTLSQNSQRLQAFT